MPKIPSGDNVHMHLFHNCGIGKGVTMLLLDISFWVFVHLLAIVHVCVVLVGHLALLGSW